jgi:hypothetical protein
MSRRRIAGLNQVAPLPDDVPDGFFLVRVDRLHYRWDRQKPFFSVRFVVIEPEPFVGRVLSGRLYCTPKALWKFSWFLRDFGYDRELLGREEIDERAIVDLNGVVNVSHATLQGRSFLNFEGFAPAGQWAELAQFLPPGAAAA